ncbi:putative proline-rich receptor-like protein kinase PERK3 [Iris pallida]|uniref:Proline-rich receptor-like protein kinase PERK3 n=1 Tax=Iris pallida TaxID=29817 RepID=A0AAX6FSN4_IRIPA|nr:putative proline-rich receptor-like protein kinase PERK3 [Iris pallida]
MGRRGRSGPHAVAAPGSGTVVVGASRRRTFSSEVAHRRWRRRVTLTRAGPPMAGRRLPTPRWPEIEAARDLRKVGSGLRLRRWSDGRGRGHNSGRERGAQIRGRAWRRAVWLGRIWQGAGVPRWLRTGCCSSDTTGGRGGESGCGEDRVLLGRSWPLLWGRAPMAQSRRRGVRWISHWPVRENRGRFRPRQSDEATDR